MALSFATHFIGGSTNLVLNKQPSLHPRLNHPVVRISPATCSSSTTSTAERARPCHVSSSSSSSSLYDILGVDTRATCQEIKIAYRRLARFWHPDVRQNDGAGHEFMKINEAYATLSDPEKRSAYDVIVFRQRYSNRQQQAVTVGCSVSGYSGSGSGYTYTNTTRPRRSWETDQCW